MKKIASFLLLALILILNPLHAFAASDAPDFELKNLEGKEVRLSNFEGRENVLLAFGATWCGYCATKIPDLNNLQEKYGSKGLKVIGVDVGESATKVSSYADEMGIQYEVVLDEDKSVAYEYGVRGVPTVFFINKEGKVLETGHMDLSFVDGLMQE